MSDTAAIITSIVGALAVAGGAVKWLWGKVEARFAKIEKDLEACKEREMKAVKREGGLLIVIELLWQEIERRSRGAPNAVLGQARKIMDELKEETKP